MRKRPEPAELSQDTVRRVVDRNREELMWIAEVMTGSRTAGEQCVAEAAELAEAARYVGQEWILSWVKRLLVHISMRRISGDLRELLVSAGAGATKTPSTVGASAVDRQNLLRISPQTILDSLDVLERTCFILYAYLAYPMLDCALLLGCPCSRIRPICERVLSRIDELDRSAPARFHKVISFDPANSQQQVRLSYQH